MIDRVKGNVDIFCHIKEAVMEKGEPAGDKIKGVPESRNAF
jgi:hypothetical protein